MEPNKTFSWKWANIACRFITIAPAVVAGAAYPYLTESPDTHLNAGSAGSAVSKPVFIVILLTALLLSYYVGFLLEQRLSMRFPQSHFPVAARAVFNLAFSVGCIFLIIHNIR